jgi:hypothetical protein
MSSCKAPLLTPLLLFTAKVNGSTSAEQPEAAVPHLLISPETLRLHREMDSCQDGTAVTACRQQQSTTVRLSAAAELLWDAALHSCGCSTGGSPHQQLMRSASCE